MVSARRLGAVVIAVFLLFPVWGRCAPVIYTADTVTDFKNPERGLFVQTCFYGAGRPGNEPINAEEFRNAVAGNPTRHTAITLMRRYFCLKDFRTTDISADALAQIRADFSMARTLGIKLIPRFTYNQGPIGQPDASESVILRHISQLQPILRENADVIAYMETGFIGTWGECHHSTNGLTADVDLDATSGMGHVLRRVLEALPPERMVAMRYPGYTRQIFNRTEPVSEAEAFDGAPFSRVGVFDDCFEADYWDEGTYYKGAFMPTAAKAYLGRQNLYTVEGGESCLLSDYASCENTLADLRKLHWSTLHVGWEPHVIQGWIDGGCMDMIAALGYRYRLVSSRLPSSVRPGGVLPFRLEMANDGTASCYNPRAFEVILRPKGQQGLGTCLALKPDRETGTDARFWTPGGVTTTVIVNIPLPANLATGKYDVLLNLPDPQPSLHGRPEYSIRLANKGDLWEAATGYNNLSQTVNVKL